MADDTPIKVKDFVSLYKMVEGRANIKGVVQDYDRNIIKGFINEHYVEIATERNWSWRKFNRSYVFEQGITTGTVSVTNGNRTVTFAGLAITKNHLDRHIRIGNDQEFYRIIGVNVGTNQAYLEAAYVGTTNAAATYKMYRYEFALPPDCDTVSLVHIDSPTDDGYLEELNNDEFTRLRVASNGYSGKPEAYTRDGQTYVNPSLIPLGQFVLGWDFLGGSETAKTEKISFWPIEPDKSRVVHVNYSLMVRAMEADEDVPIFPIDDRWVLVRLALADWWRRCGQLQAAAAEERRAMKRLNEMRSEQKKTDTKPKFIMDARRYRRTHTTDRRRDLFLISRQGEV